MVLDTNILIAFVHGDPQVVALMDRAETRTISRISYIEFFADDRLTSPERSAAHQMLRDYFSVVDVHAAIADRAIMIRRKKRSCKLPDAIILATALECGEALYSFDQPLKRAFPRNIIVPHGL